MNIVSISHLVVVFFGRIDDIQFLKVNWIFDNAGKIVKFVKLTRLGWGAKISKPDTFIETHLLRNSFKNKHFLSEMQMT